MDYLAHFFAACMLTNSIPHLVKGVTGVQFQTPFAKPPGIGLSSPVINVVWACINFTAGFLLLFKVGSFSVDNNIDVAVILTGMWFTAYRLAHHLGPLYAQNAEQSAINPE